jgi:hypothetical protein
MEALWQMVLSGRVSDRSDYFDLYSWTKRLKRSGLTALLPDLVANRLVEILTGYAPHGSSKETLETWIIFPDRQMLAQTHCNR